MKQSQYQQGSAHVVLIVCLVAVLIAALGWIFWQNFIYKAPEAQDQTGIISNDLQKDNKKDPVPLVEEPELYKGIRVTSGKGAYSVKIPNGWYVTVEKDDDGIQESLKYSSKDLQYNEATDPVIEKVDYIGGHDAPVFSVGARPGVISEEQYTKTPFALDDGVEGVKYYRFIPARKESFVPNMDTYTYVYRFNKGSRTVTASWTEYLNKGEALDAETLELIEQVVKSIEIK